MNHMSQNFKVPFVPKRWSESTKSKEMSFVDLDWVCFNLPLRPTQESSYQRKNGKFELLMKGNSERGLPYGKDRWLLLWLTNEVVKRGSAFLQRNSKGEILKELEGEQGLPSNGENLKWLTGAFHRILYTQFWIRTLGKEPSWRAKKILKSVEGLQSSRGPMRIELHPEFLEHLVQKKRFVPVDLRVLRGLKKNHLASYLYPWVGWRIERLALERRKELKIPLNLFISQCGVSEQMLLKKFKFRLKENLKLLDSLFHTLYQLSFPAKIQEEALILTSFSPTLTPSCKQEKVLTPSAPGVSPEDPHSVLCWSEETRARFEQWRASTPWEEQKKLLPSFIPSGLKVEEPAVQAGLEWGWNQKRLKQEIKAPQPGPEASPGEPPKPSGEQKGTSGPISLSSLIPSYLKKIHHSSKKKDQKTEQEA